jgi:hypothetical protein
MENELTEWYAYVTDEKVLHIKRYRGDLEEVTEREEDPLTLAFHGPFEAMGSGEASAIAEIQLQSFME